jgi:hypothetical protein
MERWEGRELTGNGEEGQKHTGNGGSVRRIIQGMVMSARSIKETVGVSGAYREWWECQEHTGNGESVRSVQRMVGGSGEYK